MLRGIHKATGSWVGKIVMGTVMGVLVISFAIWGIGDIFRGFGQNSAAKVGGTEISTEEFSHYYNDRLQQLSRRFGRSITPDQARALGLDRQILSQLIAETALDEKVHNWRLGLSNTAIATRIMGDPSFHDASGKFDRQRFEILLRNAGYTEDRFVEEQRRELLRRQITQSIAGDIKVSKTVLAAMNQYRNEKRSINYVTLTKAQAGDIPKPTPEELSKYFEQRKALFRAPEYRKITVLSVTPADQARWIVIPDADARAYYNEHKANYGTPEKRDVHQIVFQKPEEAAAARERLVKGLSFADLAKERGLKPSDTDLGMVTKTGIIDPAIANAAFALKQGEVSAPVKGRFGVALLQVSKIEPGTQKTYEEVAPEIKRKLAEGKAIDKINDLRDKIEDERAAGSTLAETAKKLGLTSRTIDAVDRSGMAPDGKPVPDLPKSPNVVTAAFASDVGVDNDALQLPDGGFLWYSVNGITPARDRKLDEVKSEVETHWREDEIGKRLKTKADAMVAKLKTGATLAQLVGEAAPAVKVETASDLQRGKPAAQIANRVVEMVFNTAKGAPGTSEGATQDQRYVFRVTGVTDPKLDPNSADEKSLESTLQNSYADDINGEYIAQLENEVGVTFNQAAINQVIGGGTNQ
jgi:peptidyl-prolyl cis-trans isomerase D